MRAAYKIQRVPYTGAAQDDYNNTIDTWGAPVDVYVYGANRRVTEEPTSDGHHRLVVERVLLVTKSFTATSRDRFILPDDPEGLYEAQGLPESTEGNPFGWIPGGRMKVRRVNG